MSGEMLLGMSGEDGSFPGISANFKIMCCGTEPFFRVFYVPGGPGSSVRIATGYGLDGPGIEW
jgi:hypothetical protein